MTCRILSVWCEEGSLEGQAAERQAALACPVEQPRHRRLDYDTVIEIDVLLASDPPTVIRREQYSHNTVHLFISYSRVVPLTLTQYMHT